jgi:hypothetical protein
VGGGGSATARRGGLAGAGGNVGAGSGQGPRLRHHVLKRCSGGAETSGRDHRKSDEGTVQSKSRPTGTWISRAAALALLVQISSSACGHAVTTTTPPPTPQDIWYFYPVLCSPPPNGCAGLTAVGIDRSSTPPRVTLPVGKLTSLRAKSLVGCGQFENQITIRRWVVGDPSVISVQPSSTESAIVTALTPGVTRLTAERVLPDGSISVAGLSDPLRFENSGCAPQSEFVFEVVP